MLLIIAIIFSVLLVHPYSIYPLSLRFFLARPLHRHPGNERPSATLVFCAFNEEGVLPSKIANLRAIKELHPDMRIRAYADLSSDKTLEILQANSDLVDVLAATERTGKAVGMRRLVAASDTEVMIFTDANVIVAAETLGALLDYFSDPQIGGVCGTLIYTNSGDSATASANSTYWRIEEWIKKSETRCGSTMGADGSLFATRRCCYPEVPSHLLDDFIVSMSTIFAGQRLISASDVIAYERTAVKSADEFRRKQRIACRAFSSHRHLAPQLRKMTLADRYKYISHRLIRWLGAAWAILSALFGLAWIFQVGGLAALAGALIALVLIATLALTGRVGKLRWIGELARALWATLLGVYDSVRGKRYQTWQPAVTR